MQNQAEVEFIEIAQDMLESVSGGSSAMVDPDGGNPIDSFAMVNPNG